MGGTKERRGWGFKVCCVRVSTAGGLKGKGADKCIGYRVLRNLRRAEAWKGLGRSGSRKWSGLRVVRETPGDQEAESGLKAQVGTQQTRSEVQARIIWEHKSTGSGTMRLPEAQVPHGVPGAIHSLPGVSAPDRLRHDSCDSPRQRRKAHRPQFPWQQGRGTREAEEMLRAQPKVSCNVPPARAQSESDPGGGCERGPFGVLRSHRLPRVRQSSLTPKTAHDALNKWGNQGSAIGPFHVDSEMMMGTRPRWPESRIRLFSPRRTAFHRMLGNCPENRWTWLTECTHSSQRSQGRRWHLLRQENIFLEENQKKKKVSEELVVLVLVFTEPEKEETRKLTVRKEIFLLLNWFFPCICYFRIFKPP